MASFTTPKKSGEPAAGITPNSKTAGSQTDLPTKHKVADVNPYLEHDLKYAIDIPLDSFWDRILPRSPDVDRFLEVAKTVLQKRQERREQSQSLSGAAKGKAGKKDKKVKKKDAGVDWNGLGNTPESLLNAAFDVMDSYLELLPKLLSRSEGSLYRPFADICNLVLAAHAAFASKSQPKLAVYFQDPRILKGSVMKRKPDLGVIRRDWMDHRTDIQSLKDNLGEIVFWGHLEHFIEMKHRKGASMNKVKKASASKTPTSSTSRTKAKSQSLQPSTGEGSSQTGKRKRKEESGIGSTQSERKKGKIAVGTTDDTEADSDGEFFHVLTVNHLFICLPFVLVLEDPLMRELDIPDTELARETKLQCASYGMEMLSSGNLRSHAIGMLVDGDWLQMSYYDHSRIIFSNPLQFDKEEGKLALLSVLVSLDCLTDEQAGLVPKVKFTAVRPDYNKSKLTAEEKKKDVLVGCCFTLDGVVVEVIDVLYRPHGVIGRGNIVILVKCIEILCAQEWTKEWTKVGDEFIVKIGYPSESREAETSLIQTALNTANNDEHKWVLKHLPEVLYERTYEFQEGSTERSLLSLHPNDYEERVLRIVVQRSLEPLGHLESATEFAQVFYDIFQCHRWLYDHPRILHRDISMGNIMVRRDTNRKVFGVLIDFDLSSSVEKTNSDPTSRQRTGTRPYMAYDLLKGTSKHLYRHDVESLFYVMLYRACRFNNAKELMEKPSYPPPKWDHPDDDTVADSKSSEILLKATFNPPVTPYFEHFRLPLRHFQVLFGQGYRNIPFDLTRKEGLDFDYETLGGELTYEHVLKCMEFFSGPKLQCYYPASKSDNARLLGSPSAPSVSGSNVLYP